MKNNFFRSLRFRILILLLIIGIIPCVIVSIGILNSYESRAVSVKMSELQTQANILVDQVSDADFINGQENESIDNEIEQFANFFNGRVMVVNSSYKIIKDSYSMEEGKVIIASEVLGVFDGESSVLYHQENNFIGIVLPIEDTLNDTIIGALIVNVSTESINDNVEELRQKSIVIQLAVYVIIWGIAIFLSTKLVKPFGRVTSAIDGMSEGYLEENISILDYTETVLISEAFNKLLARIKVLDDSRQEFVSNVSHELKTPITSVKVLADSLLMQENVPVELYQEFMKDIAEEIDRENKIINDLLSLVRMDKSSTNLNINSININETIELILKRLRPIAAKRNIELVFESFRPVTAEVDEVKLTLALSNLVENAIKYNKDEGWVHVSLNADHKYFFVEVADSGMGIPEESVDHIFERFYRVDKSHSTEISGTGLGLAITRNAILMHRGAVKVYSKENEGTTFTVRIPLNYIS